MRKHDLFARLAQYLGKFGDPFVAGQLADPSIMRKRLKKLRPPRYKPFASYGYRGLPKTENRPGSIAAPTIDQVRKRERKYGQRIHVRKGIMFFASDGMMWTKEEAAARQGEAHGTV